MSVMEKVIGIAAVIGIGIVFIIVITVGSAYLLRWRQKGVNPNNAFPRNPNGGGLPLDRQRALNVGAILAGSNNDFCDSLQTSKAMAKKTIQTILARDWEISSGEEALERLESLKYCGQRPIGNYLLKNAAKLLASAEPAPLNPRDVYEQVGFSLLDQRILAEYADEVALAEAHVDLMDKLVEASSIEEVKAYQDLFGDEETFVVCIQIFRKFYEQCLVGESRLANLKKTLPDLQKNGYLGQDISELANVDITAWDMGRMVNVARYSFDLGYLSESQAWDYIFFAERESASHYADWADFGRAYIVGRALWGGDNINLYGAMSTLEQLKKDSKSPWALAALH